MRNQLIAVFVFASCAAAQATSLSPTDKAALLKGTNDSCLENQVKDTTNKAMTVGQLQTYCDCYARAFSDYMKDYPHHFSGGQRQRVMQLGEVVFGGVGSGLYGMAIWFAVKNATSDAPSSSRISSKSSKCLKWKMRFPVSTRSRYHCETRRAGGMSKM